MTGPEENEKDRQDVSGGWEEEYEAMGVSSNYDEM